MRPMPLKRKPITWRVHVEYPCHVSVVVDTMTPRDVSVCCPVHGTAHPGAIEIRHEMFPAPPRRM